MDIFNMNIGDIPMPDGENLWQKYIDENKDKGFSVKFSDMRIPTAQEDLVTYFMFFDTEN